LLKEKLEVLDEDFATDLNLNARAIQAKNKGFTEPQVHENLMNGKNSRSLPGTSKGLWW